jgi:hypothetical protein
MMRVASCSADISSEKKPTMPPAHSAVEVGQAGRQPGQAAVALISARRHVHRRGQRLGETLKA